MTNQERVGKGLELLREGLAPYVEREVEEAVRKSTVNLETVRVASPRTRRSRTSPSPSGTWRACSS
jgi:hypothetical protein